MLTRIRRAPACSPARSTRPIASGASSRGPRCRRRGGASRRRARGAPAIVASDPAGTRACSASSRAAWRPPIIGRPWSSARAARARARSIPGLDLHAAIARREPSISCASAATRAAAGCDHHAAESVPALSPALGAAVRAQLGDAAVRAELAARLRGRPGERCRSTRRGDRAARALWAREPRAALGADGLGSARRRVVGGEHLKLPRAGGTRPLALASAHARLPPSRRSSPPAQRDTYGGGEKLQLVIEDLRAAA